MRADQAAFRDLLQLGRRTTRLSAFQLEGDAIVGPSSMLALVPAGTGQEATRDERRPIFADELLTEGGPVAGLDDGRSRWLALRRARPALSDGRYGGYIEPRAPQPYRVSRVDRYVDCPFKYFAETVLGLDEEREQAAGLSPLERGTLVHTLFERFYAEWQRRGERAITPAVMSEALELFRALADDALAPLADADRALERARLFGSIVGMGVAERVFELEAERGADVAERRLEMVLNGTYGFPRLSGVAERPIEIRGTADRVDVLADGSLAIVDYKLGRMPDLSASIQIAVYAHAAGQMLERADGRPHPVAFASYLAFGDDRRLEGQLGRPGDPVPIVVRSRAAAFAAAVERIESGAFPARPRHASDCQWCGYAGVCRKEYRSDEHEAAGPA
jgi:RecB family exonuclease